MARAIGTVDLEFTQLKNAKIMMVDDEPIMMDIVQAFLEDEGYHNFVTLDKSPEAIDLLTAEMPDILLLDLDMPDINGYEILITLRHMPEFKFLPVIILTASSEPDSKLKALEYGATDFLSKPIDPRELALRLRNTLAAKSYQDQLAYYDSLTGLPNRAIFIDRLKWSIGQAERQSKPVTLIDIGLDRFRQINETLGPKVGDQVLQITAERILEVVRSSDDVSRRTDEESLRSIARLGGDEFTLMLCGLDGNASTEHVCLRVLRAIKEPIIIDGQEISISACIGIAVFPADGADADTIIKNASTANKAAKLEGADSYKYYSKEMNQHAQARLHLENRLRKAVDNQEFDLYFQPKINPHTGVVVGMEALLRWFDEEYGMTSPVDFIPIAETMGLIVPIGEWVVEEACRCAQHWYKSGYDLKVSVNVSGRQFSDPNLLKVITKSLLKSGLSASRLVIEMTESMMMGDVDANIVLLNKMKQLGLTISIDDFGTGYSSLSYLKKFPIDELKIDRSFVMDTPGDKDDSSIVKAIIAMSHVLDLVVVAEGVEEIEQLEFLKANKCDIIQGFYFSKALSVDDFTQFLQNQSKLAV